MFGRKRCNAAAANKPTNHGWLLGPARDCWVQITSSIQLELCICKTVRHMRARKRERVALEHYTYDCFICAHIYYVYSIYCVYTFDSDLQTLVCLNVATHAIHISIDKLKRQSHETRWGWVAVEGSYRETTWFNDVGILIEENEVNSKELVTWHNHKHTHTRRKYANDHRGPLKLSACILAFQFACQSMCIKKFEENRK